MQKAAVTTISSRSEPFGWAGGPFNPMLNAKETIDATV
jgi:hypothetical protein